MFEKLFKNELTKTSGVSNPEPWFIDFLNGGNSNDIQITPNLALNLGTVYKCVTIRAGTISKMPIHTFMRTENGKKRVQNDVSYLLEVSPNRLTTPSQMKKMISIDIDLWGDSYILIEKNRKELKRLEPWRTQITLMSDGSLRYKYNSPISLEEEIYTDEEVMHFKDFGTDGIKGKSKIQLARETLNNMKSSNKLLSKYYQNGTLAKGILTHPATLGEEAKDSIKKAWREANTGLNNAYDIPVVDSGLEYKDISMSFEDAQFLNLTKFSVEEMARFFNVPPYMVGIMDGAKFNNVQSQAMDFISNSIQPQLTDIEEEMDYKLFYTGEKKKGIYVKFNMSAAMRSDDISRANYYKIMKEQGVYSINDILEKEDMNTIGENGDIHWSNLNFVPLDIAKEYQLGKAGAKMPKGGDESNE